MIYQIHTCLINIYEEGTDWLIEADSVKQAKQKAKNYLWGLWNEHEIDPRDDPEGWDGDHLELFGGERILKIEDVIQIDFNTWVEYEIAKQAIGDPKIILEGLKK